MKKRQMREHATAIAKLYGQGLNMREIGERMGNISRQRIQRILVRYPDLYDETKEKRLQLKEAQREQELNAQLLARMQRALDGNLVCVVCGCWILRNTTSGGSPRTCSSGCTADYQKARWAFSGDGYMQTRLGNAKTFLHNPDKYGPSLIAWAQRTLSDNDPGPNRRYTVLDSFADCHPNARLVPFQPSSDSEVETETKG